MEGVTLMLGGVSLYSMRGLKEKTLDENAKSKITLKEVLKEHFEYGR